MVPPCVELKILIDGEEVEVSLSLPLATKGIVLFAHGSGSSRFSPRNKFVANFFNNHQIGTLLFDLLTKKEEQIDLVTGEFRFNIELLGHRLIGVTQWLKSNPRTKNYSLGYFGASTGAAAALIAAANLPYDVAAVVSRGGRPDLAGDYLLKVRAPTLLLVGSLDTEVIKLNNHAMIQLTAEKKLVLVDGASHLFEESGTLEKVAKLSADWFLRYFF